MHLSDNNKNWIFWKLRSWNMHEQRTRLGKCLQAVHSNLFFIWGFDTTPLCFPTEALHRKAVNKTPQRRSLPARSPTCSCHSRRTGRRAELLTHLAHDRENDMTGEEGRWRDREGGKSLGRWEGMYNEAALGFHLIVFDGFQDKSPGCIREPHFLHLYPSLSISEFLLRKTYHHPIIFL